MRILKWSSKMASDEMIRSEEISNKLHELLKLLEDEYNKNGHGIEVKVEGKIINPAFDIRIYRPAIQQVFRITYGKLSAEDAEGNEYAKPIYLKIQSYSLLSDWCKVVDIDNIIVRGNTH